MLHDLVQSALHFIESLGVWGILLGLMLEVIPSEIVLAYGGYLVSRGEVSLTGAIVFGTIGRLVQQVILYWIGRYGGRPFLDKFGKFLHLKPKHLDKAEEWFNRYGAGMVFTARFLPVLRQAISIPAGMARMSMLKFLFTRCSARFRGLLFSFIWDIHWEKTGSKSTKLRLPTRSLSS
ncbi:DedA family protein [Paenibacillus sp. P26]|nr:DedA family protein [Paenibacillus sp. P26]